MGNRTEVLGAMLGPGVGSPRCDCVGPGWDVEAGRGAIPRVGDTEVQTASTLALPGTATELQLGEGEVWSGDDRGQKGSAWPGSLMGARPAGRESQQPRCGREHLCHTRPQDHPFLCPPLPLPMPPDPVLTSRARQLYTCWLSWDPPARVLWDRAILVVNKAPKAVDWGGGGSRPVAWPLCALDQQSPRDRPPCSSRTEPLSHSRPMGPARVCG